MEETALWARIDDPLFRAARDFAGGAALDRALTEDFRRREMFRTLRAVQAGFCEPSRLYGLYFDLAEPLIAAPLFGVQPALEICLWGMAFQTPAQSDRFLAELALLRGGQAPADAAGAPWLFTDAALRTEAGAAQRTQLLRLIELAGAGDSAACFAPPPADCEFPRLRPGRIYGTGMTATLAFPLSAPLEPARRIGERRRLVSTAGEQAVLRFEERHGAPVGVGCLADYTPADEETVFALCGDGPDLTLCYFIPSSAPLFLLDPAAPRWAPFARWYAAHAALERRHAEAARRLRTRLTAALLAAADERA